jgi:hypothetical protein
LSVVAIDDATKKLVGIFTAWDPFKMNEMTFMEGMNLSWKISGAVKKYKGLGSFLTLADSIAAPMLLE